jgi:hypothetical protein
MRIVPALLLAALLAAIAEEAVAEPGLILSGEISGADHQSYREIPIEVPSGVDRITVIVTYDKADKTVVDLGVWDPQRFRGWSGGTRDRFTLAASDATPGYLAGSLPAGRWRLMLGVPNARAASRSAYSVRVFFDRGSNRQASAAIADPPLNDQPGWYRGDLHMHSAHSDGSCASQQGKRVPCPLFRTVEAASAAGLDFVALTEHNTVSHFGEIRQLQPWFDRLLLIPGAEITTFQGHANIFGQAGFVDFRVGTPSVPDVRALARNVAAAGAIMSINHPALPSGEMCMGCGWTAPETDYGAIAAIEAVNAKMVEGPYAGLGFWYARLNEGHRLTGIGNSDNHDPDAPEDKARIGRPTTVVHASALSQDAILEGIRRGNVFIDVEGSRNRLLEVEAASRDQRAIMGETLRPRGDILVKAHVVGSAGGSVELVANGRPDVAPKVPLVANDQTVEISLDRSKACGWISVNVRAPQGQLLLVGNPIYVSCN